MFLLEGETNVDSQSPQAETETPLETKDGPSEDAEGGKILDPVQACRTEKRTLSERMRGQKKKVQLALAGFVLMSTLGSSFSGTQRAEAGEKRPEGTRAEERKDVIDQKAQDLLREVIKAHKESKEIYAAKKSGAKAGFKSFIELQGPQGVEALKRSLQDPQIANDLKGPGRDALLEILQQYSPRK